MIVSQVWQLKNITDHQFSTYDVNHIIVVNGDKDGVIVQE
jgi:hypothetical protein